MNSDRLILAFEDFDQLQGVVLKNPLLSEEALEIYSSQPLRASTGMDNSLPKIKLFALIGAFVGFMAGIGMNLFLGLQLDVTLSGFASSTWLTITPFLFVITILGSGLSVFTCFIFSINKRTRNENSDETEFYNAIVLERNKRTEKFITGMETDYEQLSKEGLTIRRIKNE